MSSHPPTPSRLELRGLLPWFGVGLSLLGMLGLLHRAARLGMSDGPHLIGVEYRLAGMLRDGEPGAALSAFLHLLAPHPPLGYVPGIASFLVLGLRPYTPLVAMALVMILIWDALQRLTARAAPWIWLALLASPLVWLYVEQHGRDLAAAAATLQALSWLVQARGFTDRRASFCFGLWMGIGLLTKYTFPIFLWLPCLYEARALLRRGAWRGFAFTLGGFLLAAGPWLLVNGPGLLEYILASSAGGGAVTFDARARPWSERLSPAGLLFYPLALKDALGWPGLILVLLGLGWAARDWLAWDMAARRGRSGPSRLETKDGSSPVAEGAAALLAEGDGTLPVGGSETALSDKDLRLPAEAVGSALLADHERPMPAAWLLPLLAALGGLGVLSLLSQAVDRYALPGLVCLLPGLMPLARARLGSLCLALVFGGQLVGTAWSFRPGAGVTQPMFEHPPASAAVLSWPVSRAYAPSSFDYVSWKLDEAVRLLRQAHGKHVGEVGVLLSGGPEAPDFGLFAVRAMSLGQRWDFVMVRVDPRDALHPFMFLGPLYLKDGRPITFRALYAVTPGQPSPAERTWLSAMGAVSEAQLALPRGFQGTLYRFDPPVSANEGLRRAELGH